jgi:hypothetical protein
MFTSSCPRCGSQRIQRGFYDPPLYLRLAGVFDLLCNNCNFEFRGRSLPGLHSRRPSDKKEVSTNQRRAPRFNAQVSVTASLMQMDPVSKGLRFSSEVSGCTRVVNEAGFGLVLPMLLLGDGRLSEAGQKLSVRLFLPTGTITVHARAANIKRLDPKDGGESGWLVGAGITKISEPDRKKYKEYLDSFLAEKKGGSQLAGLKPCLR